MVGVRYSRSMITSASAKPCSTSPCRTLMCLSRLPSSHVLVDVRRFGRARKLRIAHDGQRLVFHFDQFERLRGDFGVFRRDDGDRIAHVTHFIGAQHRPIGVDQAVNILAGHVFVRQHGVDAGQRLRFTGVDLQDPRVGMRRAQRAPDQHPRESQIIGEFRAPGDFVHDFLRRDRPSDSVQRRDRLRRFPGDRAVAA